MAEIKASDITLENFLKFFCSSSFPVAGKIQLSDADFLTIAFLAKLNESVRMR